MPPHRVRRLAQSLKRDSVGRTQPAQRFTNVDDVTQDHADLRANCTNDLSVFCGVPDQRDIADVQAGKCFFGAIYGVRRLTTLIYSL